MNTLLLDIITDVFGLLIIDAGFILYLKYLSLNKNKKHNIIYFILTIVFNSIALFMIELF